MIKAFQLWGDKPSSWQLRSKFTPWDEIAIGGPNSAQDQRLTRRKKDGGKDGGKKDGGNELKRKKGVRGDGIKKEQATNK